MGYARRHLEPVAGLEHAGRLALDRYIVEAGKPLASPA
jgi:hypothetical protein